MSDSGWQTTRADSLTFLIRRLISDTQFTIFLSDVMSLWCVEGTANDLLSMSKKENPLCEFEQSKVIKNIFNLFDKNLTSLKVGSVENTSRTLKMCANIGNVPFNLVWSLNKQKPDVLYKEVTLPLLLTAQDLTLRQDHLCRLLKCKDAEIMEYRSENGPSRWRKHKPDSEMFVEKEFKSEMFVKVPQDSADPVAFSSNSDLLCILNRKINSSAHDSSTYTNGVKIEPPETLDMPMESQSQTCQNLKVKIEGLADQHLETHDVKPKVENPGNSDEGKPIASKESKLKRRKKVKLNL